VGKIATHAGASISVIAGDFAHPAAASISPEPALEQFPVIWKHRRRVGKAKRAHQHDSGLGGGHAEPVIGPAHRVRPLAGPMAGSGRTRWLCPPYK